MNVNRKRKSHVVAIVALTLFVQSCSLKYAEAAHNVEATVPEFVFDNADFIRYENNKQKFSLFSYKLEQYKGGNETYASGVTFATYDEAGEIETEGSCELLSSNAREKKYSLYDKIELANHPQNVIIKANELRWNGRSEQITSRRSDTITIKKDNMTIIGSGFSASGVSNSFAFTGAVSGFMETTDDAAQEELIDDND
ncbi:MAG: LPS export ABC transporter periplasmic protein LptC [Treponema sp.]|nr:LPS export ABC transporter periplasmic protein LptC [Treponema sp.]